MQNTNLPRRGLMEKQIMAECPTCGQPINPKKLQEITATIAAEKDKEYAQRYKNDLTKAIEEKTIELAARVTSQETELKKYRDKESALLKREGALKLREEEIQLEVERRVRAEYDQKAKSEIQKAVKAATQKMEAKVTTAEEELSKFRSAEKDLLEREAALVFRGQEIDLEVQRKVTQAQEQLIAQAMVKTEAKYALKLQEKDKAIADMRTKLIEAEAKADAAGAQMRGDLKESELLDRLKALYPIDQIEQIAKSRGGADILQEVIDQGRTMAGSILWESKNTQNWSDSWPSKLREDQRRVNADIAVLVTAALPDDQPKGGFREGVLVLRHDTVEEVAPILRQSLINIQQQKASGQLQDEKAQRIIEYLGGKEFNLLLTGIVEDMSAFRELDEKEECFILRTVAHRRELRQRSTRRLARMFGTFQGIMGALPEVPGLQLLEPPTSPETLTDRSGTDIDTETN